MRTSEAYAFLFATLIEIAPAQPRPAHLEIQMGHPAGIEDVRFSRDNRLLLTLGTDVRTCLWDLATGKELRCFPDTPALSARFSPAQNAVLIASLTGVILRDINTGVVLKTFGSEAAQSIAFSPDGRLIAAAQGASVHIWDATSGDQIAGLQDWWGRAGPAAPPRPGAMPVSVSFATLHPWLLTCTGTGQVKLWDRASRQVTESFTVDADVKYCAMSPDDNLVATTSATAGDDPFNSDMIVKVLSVKSGAVLWSRRDPGFPKSLGFSANSQKIVLSSVILKERMRSIVHILESQNGTPNFGLERITAQCRNAFFDENGKRWATVDGDDRITIRSTDVDKTLVTLESKVGDIGSGPPCWNGSTISSMAAGTWFSLNVQDGHVSQRRFAEDLHSTLRRGLVAACEGTEPQLIILTGAKAYLSSPCLKSLPPRNVSA